MGGAALEGLVDDPEDAVALFESGASVSLEPCHHRGAVGPMAGVVTPSMWMWVLEDPATGRRTYCSLNEGLGKVLRYGAYGPEVLTRLRWMGDVLGPLLQAAVRAVVAESGPVDVTGILTQMLQMGDEAHNRNRAGTLMLLRDLAPAMVRHRVPTGRRGRGRCGSSAATTTSSSTSRCPPASSRSTPPATSPARRWSWRWPATAPTSASRSPAPATSGSPDRPSWPTGLFLGDYGPDDANPDIGDSAITETAGIGGFAMATAPAIVRFVGGSVPDALATTRRMHEITLGENPRWSVPVLEFQGTPTGIDVTRVCRTGILPQINTGMAGKRRRRRPGRRRAGHPARRDLPEGARRAGSGVRRPFVVDPGLFLARQISDRVHDAVGELAPGPAGGDTVVLPRDVDRLAEAHRDLGRARAVGADRLHLGGARAARPARRGSRR